MTDDRFVLGDVEAAACGLAREGGLEVRAQIARQKLEACDACPRSCRVNRLQNETRVCRTGRRAVLCSAFPHLGEEDCLRGTEGSGTIFFGYCNLRCVFCQNWDTSQTARSGEERTSDEIASVMLELQARGCHNINLVSPGHVVPQVIEAVAIANRHGLSLPIVYNTNAYDSLESLRLLDGIVDIYMPDFKFWERESARRLSKAKDYPERARAAILEMHRQVGPLKMGRDGVARRGVLVRHLVMPGQTAEAAAIFEWLAQEVSRDTFVNIMAQYRPQHQVGNRNRKGERRYMDIARAPTGDELRAAYEAAERAGLWRFDERKVRFLRLF